MHAQSVGRHGSVAVLPRENQFPAQVQGFLLRRWHPHVVHSKEKAGLVRIFICDNHLDGTIVTLEIAFSLVPCDQTQGAREVNLENIHPFHNR